MLKKRIITALITGAFLGLICIIGGGLRAGGFTGNGLYLFAMWYNRLIMGLVIGLAGDWKIINSVLNRYVRGGLLGFVISSAFFLSTGMQDTVAFLAGIVYGVIIEYTARRYD
ncbi:hypothetical protein JXL19_11650 [bacterium]|nr:hypothetical protein [bacterium]